MAVRVLADEAAENAIKDIQAVLAGPFDDTVKRLRSDFETLMNKEHWDGPSAMTFRGDVGPKCLKGLMDVQGGIGELQQKLAKIHQDIMTAGGGR